MTPIYFFDFKQNRHKGHARNNNDITVDFSNPLQSSMIFYTGSNQPLVHKQKKSFCSWIKYVFPR